MSKFSLNAYSGNPIVTWIIAQRVDGGEWEGRFLSTNRHAPTLDRVLDETPLGEMRRSEFAVFANSQDICTAQPVQTLALPVVLS